jgi:sigma-B regulation protein RsbU (phosphoserine phosphatase)
VPIDEDLNEREHAPRILLCSHHRESLDDIREALRDSNYETRDHALQGGDPSPDALEVCDLLVVDDEESAGGAGLSFCVRIRARLGDRFIPIVYITKDCNLAIRALSAESGVDGHLIRPFLPVELLVLVKSLLRIKALQDRVIEQTAELRRIHRRLEYAYEQLDQELLFARKIQQSFLPRTLPTAPGTRFAVKMEVSGRVGGDFYDVFRLDEQTIGFYVADAMGHGVPASLLTIYVKKGIVTKDILEHGYRLVEPGEVLHRLNVDLLEQQLSENPFITMVYFTWNYRDRKLTYARAGHPYPLVVPKRGPMRPLACEGTLLGVFDTEFPSAETHLEPGDRLIIFTDGIDGVRYRGRQQGQASFLACLEDHRQLPIDELVPRVYAALFPDGRHEDDFTLLGMEIS